jgi:hypothetical protein
VAVLTGVVTPRLVRHAEAAVWMLYHCYWTTFSSLNDVDEFVGCLVGFLIGKLGKIYKYKG